MDQNTPNRTPVTAAVSRGNNWPSKKLMIVLSIAALVLFTIGTLLYFSGNQPGVRSGAPLENTFYTAEYNNKPVLFFRNKEMHMSGSPANPYMGRYVSYEYSANAKHHSEDYADFRRLENPKKLFSFERYATIENFVLSDDKNYMSMSFLGGTNDTTNYIYQANLKTAESKKIWENELYEGEAPFNSGTAYITNFVPDRYIVFALIKGEPAPAGVPGGVVVKNIQSGNEKVLGVVGDTKVDVTGNNIAFKSIEKVQAPCIEKDPQCFATDTYKMVYLPSGETLTQPLP